MARISCSIAETFQVKLDRSCTEAAIEIPIKKESVQEFADAMKQLFREAGIPEAMQILQFAQKLQPELSHRVMDRHCTALEQAILSAAQYEANDNHMKDRQSPHRTSNMQRFADTVSTCIQECCIRVYA